MERMPYPACEHMRSGCKVGWRYYPDEATAKQCADAAQHNARIAESQGYDFGFCSPGSMRKVDEGLHAGLIEVCIP